MRERIIFGALGALIGIGLGAVQYGLLRRLLPRDGQPVAVWVLPVKFALWAAAILGGLLVRPVFALGLVGSASLFYVGCAIRVYLRARREE